MLEHRIERHLLFHEADPAGIAQFHQLFAWLQDAEQSLFRSLEIPLREYWASGGKAQIGWARQHASLDFIRPILVDELVTVHIRVSRMSKRSLTFEALIENGQEVKARGMLRTVCVKGREDKFKPIPIPKLIRDKIGSSLSRRRNRSPGP